MTSFILLLIGVNMVMLMNIAIIIDKTHNIHDLIYAASTFMILQILSWFAYELLFRLLRKYEYFMDKNMFWFT